MTNKTTKNYGFSTVFLQFLGFGSNFSAPNYQIDSVDSFASLETPGGLKGIKVEELFQLFFGWWCRLAKKNCFLKIEA